MIDGYAEDAAVSRPKRRAITRPVTDSWRRRKERKPKVRAFTRVTEKKNVHVGSMDVSIYLVVTILILIGIIMVFSASYASAAMSSRWNHDAFFFLRRKGIIAIVCFIVMNLLANLSYEMIRPFSWLVYAITVGLLIAVVFVGIASGGAQRWLPFPIIERFQPSEIAKVTTIFFIAFLVERFPRALHSWSGLFGFTAVIGVNAALVFYGDFSGSIIVAGIGFGLVFIASPHFWRFIIAGGSGVAAVGLFLWWDSVFAGGFRGRRFTVWLDPFSEQMDMGFQIVNSLYAVAMGGWFGVGIGQSRQALILPEAHNDIIFAIIVEELGFVGAALILTLFGILVWRGVIVALKAPDMFSSMTAFGIVFALAFQTIINIAVATNSIPNTGVTLPFISYGGTSLLVSTAMAGVLLNISRYSKDKKPRKRKGRDRRSPEYYD